MPVSGMTALQGLRDVGRVQPGQRVLVIGAAGGVGSFAVQLAHAFGARVTGMCSTAKIDLVRSIGADDVIDYTREEADARGPQFDLILDTAGRRPLSLLRRALTPHGTLAIVGGEGGGRWLGGFDRQILRAPVRSVFSGQRLRAVTAEGALRRPGVPDHADRGGEGHTSRSTGPSRCVRRPRPSGTWHKVIPAAKSSSRSDDHRRARGHGAREHGNRSTQPGKRYRSRHTSSASRRSMHLRRARSWRRAAASVAMTMAPVCCRADRRGQLAAATALSSRQCSRSCPRSSRARSVARCWSALVSATMTAASTYRPWLTRRDSSM